VLLLRKDDATLPQNKDEIRSLRQKLTPCLTNGTYPIFLRKIRQLSSKIEVVKTNLTQLMTDIKSSLETNITHVEAFSSLAKSSLKFENECEGTPNEFWKVSGIDEL
jgi:hypothetical protein